ncbi:hypothetical protein BJ508DRAFT_307184 [Ascobolus immersus RN42]|uniref:Uncharacterized protein n=1 Tax=Ascobolus immersus RN42 TaxID=1160509 RepID=A0A3N4I5Q3_ASCIM|nr:hypothetical protein BJ508DRAFT_307184 [Ascobolus immersus RN42]
MSYILDPAARNMLVTISLDPAASRPSGSARRHWQVHIPYTGQHSGDKKYHKTKAMVGFQLTSSHPTDLPASRFREGTDGIGRLSPSSYTEGLRQREAPIQQPLHNTHACGVGGSIPDLAPRPSP